MLIALGLDFTFNMCCSAILLSPATYTRFSLAFPTFLSLWELSQAIKCINFSSLISLIEATGEKSRKNAWSRLSYKKNKKKKNGENHWDNRTTGWSINVKSDKIVKSTESFNQSESYQHQTSMNFQDSNGSKGYVCPSDRQLALRAK